MILQSILIYGLVLSVLYICGKIASLRTRKLIPGNVSFNYWESWIPIFFFAIIFGLRYDVGTDHLGYLSTYQTGINVDRYEYIFQYITVLFRSYNLHFFWYFALWAFIQIFSVYYALKDERYLIPYVAISLMMGQYFIHWMNGIRQDLAACIFFYAVTFIIDKKFFKYLLCCIIAFGFHKSAILLVALYPILSSAKDLTFNRLIQFIILSCAFVVAITKRDFMSELFPIINYFTAQLDYGVYSERVIESYVDKTKAGDGMSVRILFLINILIIYYAPKMKRRFQSNKFTIYYNLYYWGAVFQLFFINNLLLARPFRYFRLFNMLMIAYLLYYLCKPKLTKKNFVVLSIVMLLLLLLFAATIINEPFYFLWNK